MTEPITCKHVSGSEIVLKLIHSYIKLRNFPGEDSSPSLEKEGRDSNMGPLSIKTPSMGLLGVKMSGDVGMFIEYSISKQNIMQLSSLIYRE